MLRFFFNPPACAEATGGQAIGNPKSAIIKMSPSIHAATPAHWWDLASEAAIVCTSFRFSRYASSVELVL